MTKVVYRGGANADIVDVGGRTIGKAFGDGVGVVNVKKKYFGGQTQYYDADTGRRIGVGNDSWPGVRRIGWR